MGDYAAMMMILTASISTLGYGVVVVFWAVASTITARVGKPSRQAMHNSFSWTVISWIAMVSLICASMPSGFAALCFLLTFPVAVFASIGGACYRPHG